MDFDELKQLAIESEPPKWVRELADSMVVVRPAEPDDDADFEVSVGLDANEECPLWGTLIVNGESADALADDSRLALARIIHAGVIGANKVTCEGGAR